jgi:hypothetical protein
MGCRLADVLVVVVAVVATRSPLVAELLDKKKGAC